MANVNQKQPHCVNEMGKTHSKPLAARHGRGTAWARRATCESALTLFPLHVCLLFQGQFAGYVKALRGNTLNNFRVLVIKILASFSP